MRRLFCLIALVGIAAACDDFAAATVADAGASASDGGGTTTGNEAGATGDSGGDSDATPTVLDGGDDAPNDAAFHPETSVPDSDGLYVQCPRTAAASTFETHTMVTISSPPLAGEDRAYPFGVVTDATYVYWVSLLAKRNDANESSDAYNGSARRSRIHRALKNPGTTLAWKATLLLPGDQDFVTDLALDGKYVYWAVVSGGMVQMRRVLRACSAPCSDDEPVGAPVHIERLVRLRRAAPGQLAGLTHDGVVVTFDTGKLTWEVTGLTGRLGGFAVRSGDAFASRGDDAKIGRVEFGPSGSAVTEMFATIEPPDGGTAADIGTGLLATDCQSLFAYRFDRSLWRLDLQADPSQPFAPWAQTTIGGVYDIFADAHLVYVGGADGAGLHAVSIATQRTQHIADGSYWRVTADESGVYAGEHTNGGMNAGAMYRFK